MAGYDPFAWCREFHPHRLHNPIQLIIPAMLLLLTPAAAFLALGSALAPQEPADPWFIHEDGTTYDLGDPNLVLDASATGKLVVPFQFQSLLLDPTTGKYVQPDMHLAWSIRNPGTDPGSQGIPWVFGGPWLGKAPSPLSFDPDTGAGEALAVLYIHMVTRETTWSSFVDGVNEVTIYWGSPSQVCHDGLHPPGMPAGSRTILFQAAQPEIELGFAPNRDAVRGDTIYFYVFARTSTAEDRVFTLTTDAPGIVSIPSTIVLPANEQLAWDEATVLDAGEVRILATSPSAPGDTLRSGLGIFSAHSCRGVGDGAILPTPGTAALARCVDAQECTPEGRDPSSPQPQEEFCGPGKLEPTYSDCAQANGQACFASDGTVEASVVQEPGRQELSERSSAASLVQECRRAYWRGLEQLCDVPVLLRDSLLTRTPSPEGLSACRRFLEAEAQATRAPAGAVRSFLASAAEIQDHGESYQGCFAPVDGGFQHVVRDLDGAYLWHEVWQEQDGQSLYWSWRDERDPEHGFVIVRPWAESHRNPGLHANPDRALLRALDAFKVGFLHPELLRWDDAGTLLLTVPRSRHEGDLHLEPQVGLHPNHLLFRYRIQVELRKREGWKVAVRTLTEEGVLAQEESWTLDQVGRLVLWEVRRYLPGTNESMFSMKKRWTLPGSEELPRLLEVPDLGGRQVMDHRLEPAVHYRWRQPLPGLDELLRGRERGQK